MARRISCRISCRIPRRTSPRRTSQEISRAAAIIRRGGIVAFPTETVYGLGADALDAKAVARIFRAKGRPADNPLIAHISDLSMLDAITVRVPKGASRLIGRFWPGPLTILFERSAAIPDIVTAGLPTVAVRMPDHPIALALIRRAGVPIAAPSANMSGRQSPTCARHVRDDFPGIVVLDGGRTLHGVESTVIDVRGRRPKVLRLGAITLERLCEVLPGIAAQEHDDRRPASPGMKHQHYRPSRPLYLFRRKDAMKRFAKTSRNPIILVKDGYEKEFSGYPVVALGKGDDDVARNLFAALRTKRKGDCLLALAVRKRGKGRAVMDRLERAATRIY